MNERPVHVSLLPDAWARRATAELIGIAERLDASGVTSVGFEDPDAHDAPGPWRWDTSTAVGGLLAVTSRVGLVVGISSGYTEPFSASRRVGSLDNLAGGRIGWLLDRSTSVERDRRTRAVSPDLGVDDPTSRARELVTASRALWDSWDEGALPIDVPGNALVDRERIHPVDFTGRHFRVAGPINLRRPPSGNPPLYVRVQRPDDVAFAVEVADVALAATPELAGDVRAAAGGRTSRPGQPGALTLLLSTTPVAAPLDAAPPADVHGIDLLVRSADDLDALWPLLDTIPHDDDRPRGLRSALALPLLRS